MAKGNATLRHQNSFQKGMRVDIDKSQMSSQSYLDSLNGRVIYNEDGTYAWENAKGTLFALTVNANHGLLQPDFGQYVLIGQCQLNGKCLIFLTNNTFGEIGLITEDQFGAYNYTAIYNDYNDYWGLLPNGKGRLKFSTHHNIKSEGIIENVDTERSYWDDDFNESRVINIIPPAGVAFYPDTISPYSTHLTYVSWFSSHGFASMPTLTWGLMKYRRNITGTLLSGKRQYAYRYIHRTGYSSPWSPLTNFIFCTTNGISSSDWNEYTMSASGIATTKGHEFEIKFLDQRFAQIEVAALYWETDAAATSAVIFFKGDITGDSIIVEHIGDVGVVVTIDQLNQRFFAIKIAKTDAISGDNHLHKGNLELYPEPQIDTTGIVALPIIKKMISDETLLVTQIPLTNQTPKTDTTTRNIFTGSGGALQEKYDIDNDYINYKGTQWEHLYKSKFRGDTYPFAVVLFDLKGQPSFAQHITDFTLPEQSGNTYTDARLSGTTTGTSGSIGDYKLTDYSLNSTDLILDNLAQGSNICPKILGMVFSGVDLTDVLFDADGQLQISGMAIVAMPRLGRIVAQGLLLNTTNNFEDGKSTSNVRPLETSFNWMEGSPFLPPSYERQYIGTSSDNQRLVAQHGTFTFEAPDGFIDPLIFGENIVGSNIELIGGVAPINLNDNFITADQMQYTAGYYTQPGVPFGLDCIHDGRIFITDYNFYPHYYNKHYLTVFDNQVDCLPHDLDGGFTAGGRFGTSYEMQKLFVEALHINNYYGAFNYDQICGISGYYPIPNQFNQGLLCTHDLFARAHQNTILMQANDVYSASLRYINPLDPTQFCYTPYYLANYRQNIATPQITKSTLDNRVYNNIGHFIPINADTIALAYDSGTGRYVFNGIEVFYGDCYVDYFCYDRLEPIYWTLPGPTDTKPICSTNWQDMPDYAIGCAFPVETVYNQMMRSGVTYPRYGTRPQATYCQQGAYSQENPLGIFYFSDTLKQPEDFAVNSVLNAQNIANQYNSLQGCFGLTITDFALMEVFSETKYYGECYDSFRKFDVLNYQFANGAYGEITEFAYLGGFNSIYVLQQYSFARILFNERQLVPTTGGPVTTGQQNGYGGHEYVSIVSGCQHQWSVVNTGKHLYWTDAEKGKQNRFGQNGVEPYSDLFEFHNNITKWTRNYWVVPSSISAEKRYYDNPTYLGGIHSVFDNKNESLITTFTQWLTDNNGVIENTGTPITIEFSEKLSQYQGRHGFYPTFYFPLKQSFLSFSPIGTQQLFQHDESVRGLIYDALQDSVLSFVTNPAPMEAKVYDNGRIGVDTEVGANRINLVNLTTNITVSQSVVLNNAVLDGRPDYREGFLTYPMMQIRGRQDRMRGTYLVQQYAINNDGTDTIVRITGMETLYRISARY